jgi:hypothetical protein
MLATDYAYAAGIIDGEGSILLSINRRVSPVRRVWNTDHILSVQIGCTDLAMLLRMQGIFGGGIQKRKRYPRCRQTYQWRIYSTRAAEALRAMAPYLVTKAAEASLALQFAETLGNPVDKGQRDQMASELLALRRSEVS